MPNRFQTGFQLAKQSLAILMQKKSLIVFPGICMLLTSVIFVFAITPIIKIEETTWKTHMTTTTIFFMVLAIVLIYFSIAHTITLFCNGALSACIVKHIKGEPYTICDGFKMAIIRFRKLYRWKLVMTTIGPVILFLQNWSDRWPKSQMAKNLFANLPWITATFFVLPVVIFENLSAFQAIKRSAHLVKKHWGTSVMSRYGIGGIVFVLMIVALIPLIITIFIGGKTAIIIGGMMTTILFLCISVFNSALFIILSTALYLFATNIDTSRYFDSELLKNAFKKKVGMREKC